MCWLNVHHVLEYFIKEVILLVDVFFIMALRRIFLNLARVPVIKCFCENASIVCLESASMYLSFLKNVTPTTWREYIPK